MFFKRVIQLFSAIKIGQMVGLKKKCLIILRFLSSRSRITCKTNVGLLEPPHPLSGSNPTSLRQGMTDTMIWTQALAVKPYFFIFCSPITYRQHYSNGLGAKNSVRPNVGTHAVICYMICFTERGRRRRSGGYNRTRCSCFRSHRCCKPSE